MLRKLHFNHSFIAHTLCEVTSQFCYKFKKYGAVRLNLKLSFITLLVFLFLTSLPAHSRDTQAQSVQEEKYLQLSSLELYREAKAIKGSDKKKSIEIALLGLQKAQAEHNVRLSAEIYTHLGKVARSSKDVELSVRYFQKSASLYGEINDERNQLMSNVEYANTYLSVKQYSEAEQVLQSLLPTVLESSDEFSLAIIYMTEGDIYTKQKRYQDAISSYRKALTHFVEDDSEVKKRLALTNKKVAQVYAKVQDVDNTIFFYKEALSVYSFLNNKKSMASALRNLASQTVHQGEFVIALDYAIRSLKIEKELNEEKNLVKAHATLGMIYRYLGRYEESLGHLQQAYLYYKKINHISNIAKTSKEIGLIYSRLRQFDEARSFYQVGIDLPKNKLDPKVRAAVLREIAVIDLNNGRLDSAKDFADQAYDIYKKEKDKTKQSLTARIIAKIYYAQGDKKAAISFDRMSLGLAEDMNNIIYQIKSQISLATMLGNTDEAVELLKASLALSTKADIKGEQLLAYRLLRQAEKARGNINKAFYYAEKEIVLSKAIFSEQEKNDLVKAKAKLDSHKMEMELSSLREKNKLDQLELDKKNNEIEISGQAKKITELELTKNRYANSALGTLLIICLVIVLLIYRRFIDSKARNKELDYLATHDPLTNCYNRRVLFEYMNRDFSEVELLGEYCVIMADIDHFKAVNDNHGHSVGDDVLRGVAKIMRRGIRQNDIVARFGGEEFCIVLSGADSEQALRIAEKLRKKISKARFNDLEVSCSFGVSSIKFEAKEPRDLIDQADIALYRSKTQGRNQVTLWDSSFTK